MTRMERLFDDDYTPEWIFWISLPLLVPTIIFLALAILANNLLEGRW